MVAAEDRAVVFLVAAVALEAVAVLEEASVAVVSLEVVQVVAGNIALKKLICLIKSTMQTLL